jgi:hypothetical protein
LKQLHIRSLVFVCLTAVVLWSLPVAAEEEHAAHDEHAEEAAHESDHGHHFKNGLALFVDGHGVLIYGVNFEVMF